MTAIQITARFLRGAGPLSEAFRLRLWQDRILFGFAALALAVAFAVAPWARTRPDIDFVAGYAWRMGEFFFLLLSLSAGAAFAWLGIVRKSTSPARELRTMFFCYLAIEGRAFALFNTMAVFIMFASAFSVLKAAVAILNPFAFDQLFSNLDRVLHFGRLPHEWLLPVFGNNPTIFVLNFAYNLWFYVVIASMMVCALATYRSKRRQQYLLAFMSTWFFGGFVAATLLSSAGPCYFQAIGAGTDYAGLMEHLNAAAQSVPVWALETQNVLWAGFTGARDGSAGISAMPSMHVATAVLMALAAASWNRWLGLVMWLYAAMIMAGSVVLAWHYAIDGYLGALIAIACWKLAGTIFPAANPGNR